jgi:hypothetical protein
LDKKYYLKVVLVMILSVVLLTVGFTSTAFAQFQSGGVNKPGSWYVGEGLRQGDYFSYSLCYIHYKDCSPFRISFWVESEQKVGTEDQWRLQVVVHDGAQIRKGTMNVGKIAPEPTGSTPNLTSYSAAFKSSIVWLSAYATADTGSLTGKGPKQFSMPSWGKIGNIGGEQIIPTREEKIAVPAGIFDTVLITWKTGGQLNRVWIVDEFPFPIKADTYAHVSEGVPPQEYRFELLEYNRNVTSDPFSSIVDTGSIRDTLGCETNYSLTPVLKNTNTNTMIVDLKYGPNKPKQGCDLELVIGFKRSVNQEEFENQVHYNILVVEQTASGTSVKRSIAEEEKRSTLFTTSGQVRRSIEIKESGPTTYAIFVHGTGPESVSPNPAKAGFITFLVDVQTGTPTTPTIPTTPTTPTTNIVIPPWIKNNAKWWSEGTIGDSDFVSGIQYLINQKVIQIPPTSAGAQTNNVIPPWIKNNAKWWSEGTIGDRDFVLGIQFLITNGIIKITS